MDVEQFKDDVRSGRIDADRLVGLVVTLTGQLQEARRRIEEFEQELGRRTPKLDQPFSLRAEEQRQEARGKKRPKRKPKRRRRNRTAEKSPRRSAPLRYDPQCVQPRAFTELRCGRSLSVAAMTLAG